MKPNFYSQYPQQPAHAQLQCRVSMDQVLDAVVNDMDNMFVPQVMPANQSPAPTKLMTGYANHGHKDSSQLQFHQRSPLPTTAIPMNNASHDSYSDNGSLSYQSHSSSHSQHSSVVYNREREYRESAMQQQQQQQQQRQMNNNALAQMYMLQNRNRQNQNQNQNYPNNNNFPNYNYANQNYQCNPNRNSNIQVQQQQYYNCQAQQLPCPMPAPQLPQLPPQQRMPRVAASTAAGQAPTPFMPSGAMDRFLVCGSPDSNNDTTSNTSNGDTSSSGASPQSPSHGRLPSTTYSDAIFHVFEPERTDKLQLKDVIFISKDCTYRLAQYITRENWGKECSLLYKYLDYIFRCQVFGKQVIQVEHKTVKKARYLLFHTGLQRRTDNQFLYVLLIKNSASKQQAWRVAFGNIRNSFVTYGELIKKLKEHNIVFTNNLYLPQRTKFHESLGDLLYDETFSVQANWEERLSTNEDRVAKVVGNTAYCDGDNRILRTQELMEAFTEALPRTQRMAALNPRLAVPQGFVDTKHGRYRMELLVPIIIRFPKQNGNFYKFALAVGKSSERKKKYVVKSILTVDMAYANARLVGYVDSLWLHFGNKKESNQDFNDFCVNP